MKVLNSLPKKYILLSIFILLVVSSTTVFAFKNQSSPNLLTNNINKSQHTPTATLTPSHSPTPTIKPIKISPTATPQPMVESVTANSSSSENNSSQATTQPIIIVNPQIPEPTLSQPTTSVQPSTSDAYLDYLHLLQEKNAKKLEKCSEWGNQRDTALTSLKQEVDLAHQRIKDEEANIDNMTGLSEVQKAMRKNDVMPKFWNDYSKAQEAYSSALNSFGQCPF